MLMQGTQGAPKAPLGNNARPPQPLHQRTIRTNINFQNAEVSNQLLILQKKRKPIPFFAPNPITRKIKLH